MQNTTDSIDNDTLPERSNPLWLYALIGAGAGLIVSLLAHSHFGFDTDMMVWTTILAFAGIGLALHHTQRRIALPLVIGLGGVLTASAAWWEFNDYYQRDLGVFFAFAAVSAMGIGTTFLQSWQHDKPHYTYQTLFTNAWNNVFTLKFALLFMGAFMLVLLLGTALFKQVGVRALHDFFWDEHVVPILAGILLGVGISISRNHSQIIYKLRQLIFALFRILAFLAAILVVLFTLSLPFTVGQLFAERHTSQILLALVAVSIVLLNTLVNDGSHKLPRWQNGLLMAQIIALPILTSLSVYAVSLRIAQYGLMPNRVIALIIALMLLVYSLTYAWQALKHRTHWTVGLIRFNPALAALTITVILLIFTTIIDPIRLSVNHQVARLQDGTVSVEQFDFRALKRDMGKPGERAITEIETWDDHPQIAAIRTAIADNSNGEVEEPLHIETIASPHLPKNIDTLHAERDWECRGDDHCIIKMLPVGSDGTHYPVLFVFENRHKPYVYVNAHVYHHTDQNGWRILKQYESNRLEQRQYTALQQNIRDNQIQTQPPKVLDIHVGEVEFKQ